MRLPIEKQVLSDLEHAHSSCVWHLSDMLERLWQGTTVSGRHQFLMAAVQDAAPVRDEAGDLEPANPTGRICLARLDASGQNTETSVIEADDPQAERLIATFRDTRDGWSEKRLGRGLCVLLVPGGQVAVCSLRNVLQSGPDDHGERQYYFVFALLSLDPTLPDVRGDSYSTCVLRHWLDEAADCVRHDEPWISQKPDEIMLRAGDSFMSQVVAIPEGRSLLTRAFGARPFGGFIALAFLTYEKAETSGVIDVATTREAATPDISLLSPVPLSDQRRVRKLLHATREGSTHEEGLSLLLFDDEVVGMRRCGRSPWPLTVRFLPRGSWEVVRDGKLALRVLRGRPEAPQQSPAEQAAHDVAARARGMTRPALDVIRVAVEHCLSRRHGATFVVSTEAADEAKRLIQQETQIQATPLDGRTLADLGRVDGAVVLDLEGSVHAFGVILDGEALPVEAEEPRTGNLVQFRVQISRRQIARSFPDPSRGARFNSAITYSYSRARQRKRPVMPGWAWSAGRAMLRREAGPDWGLARR